MHMCERKLFDFVMCFFVFHCEKKVHSMQKMLTVYQRTQLLTAHRSYAYFSISNDSRRGLGHLHYEANTLEIALSTYMYVLSLRHVKHKY